MIDDPWFWAVALPAVVLTGIAKGGFGGGAAVATPLIALAIPPTQAAAIMLPVLCLMDVTGIRAYLGRWHRAVMRVIVPAGIAGTAIGALTFRHIDENVLRILIGLIALGFLAWSLFPRKPMLQKPGPAKGWFWGALSGFTSFVSHAGAPPILVYLLPQKLDKDVFVGTMLVFFFSLNYLKILPYFWLGLFDREVLLTSAALVPVGIVGVYAGVWVQRNIDVRWFYRVIYTLLLFSGLKLLQAGISGL